MGGGIGGTLERHTVCSLACRYWQSAAPLWVRVRSPIGLEAPNLSYATIAGEYYQQRPLSKIVDF